MAMVLKSNNDREIPTAHAMGAPTFFNAITHKISNPAQVVGGNILQNFAMVSCQTEQHFT